MYMEGKTNAIQGRGSKPQKDMQKDCIKVRMNITQRVAGGQCLFNMQLTSVVEQQDGHFPGRKRDCFGKHHPRRVLAFAWFPPAVKEQQRAAKR